MKIWFRIGICAGLVMALTSQPLQGDTARAKPQSADREDLYAQIELFSDALSVIREGYVEEVEPKKLIEGALKGMFSSLDDFSQYLKPEEHSEIKSESKGEFGGIGIELALKDGILTVIAPLAGTPAEAAGIRPGDKIVKIGEETTRGMTVGDSVRLMRGSPGTEVVLTVWREDGEALVRIPVRRDIIKVNSIRRSFMMEDKIGYVKLAEFQEKTPRDLDDAVKDLMREGMRALVLDMRNNPGGLLEVSVDVADRLLPKGSVVVTTKARVDVQNKVFKTDGRHHLVDCPIVVLVNGGSASASEIVAGAVQDNGRGVIVGTKTFGKASVQTIVPLRDGSAIKLTTASYYTPSGRMIRKEGILPDVIVPAEPLPEKVDEPGDDIFDKVENESIVKGRDAVVSEIEKDNQVRSSVQIAKALIVTRKK